MNIASIPLISSIVSLIFALVVLDQFFVLIAVGAILPALGGILMRFNVSLTAFYLLELLGIITIFIGFLRSREVFARYRFPLIHGCQRVAVNQS